MQKTLSSARFWLAIMLPYALGYFIATVVRSVNAVLVDPIMKSLEINAMEIGLVTSTFMLAFALGQIPLGILLDYWDARKTQALFFAIGTTGLVIFALAQNIVVLAVGRAVLGIGMAGGLTAAFKAISDWVRKDKIPLYNGVLLAAGGIGALTATSPSKLFEIHFGWRALCILLAIIAFLIGLLILFGSVDKPTQQQEKSTLGMQIRGLKKVYTDSFFWQVTPLFAFVMGGFVAMQGLWLGPWLEYVVGFTPLKSANFLLIIAAGMTLGMISGGFFSYLAKLFKVRLVVIVMVGIAIHIVTQMFLVFNIASESWIMWFVYAYFAQVGLVDYALIAQHFGSELRGRSITAATILIFLFAFLVQYLFGLVLQAWPRDPGMVYSVSAYQVAFSGLIILECLAFIWFIIAALRRAKARS